MFLKLRILLILSILLTILSCEDQNSNKSNEISKGISAAVFLSAGDIDPKFNSLQIPTFFNIAKILDKSADQNNAIILSRRLNVGARVEILPLALFNFDLDTTKYSYVVSILNDDNNTMIGRNYNDFLLNNLKTQSIVEDWFASQCPELKCSNFEWNNSYKALLEIQNDN